MKHSQFNFLLDQRIKKTKEVLPIKAKDYASIDRLHSFKTAGRIANTTPEKALKGMLLKHLVAVFNIIDNLEKDLIPSIQTIDEKIGDCVNYFILLEGLLIERQEDRNMRIETNMKNTLKEND